MSGGENRISFRTAGSMAGILLYAMIRAGVSFQNDCRIFSVLRILIGSIIQIVLNPSQAANRVVAALNLYPSQCPCLLA